MGKVFAFCYGFQGTNISTIRAGSVVVSFLSVMSEVMGPMITGAHPVSGIIDCTRTVISQAVLRSPNANCRLAIHRCVRCTKATEANHPTISSEWRNQNLQRLLIYR
nr:hypothetical protein HmN_000135800 [Hymenolepis microstoma]